MLAYLSVLEGIMRIAQRLLPFLAIAVAVEAGCEGDQANQSPKRNGL